MVKVKSLGSYISLSGSSFSLHILSNIHNLKVVLEAQLEAVGLDEEMKLVLQDEVLRLGDLDIRKSEFDDEMVDGL